MLCPGKILFIINPIAGGRSNKHCQNIIKTDLRQEPHVDIVVTEYAGHAHILASEAATNGYYAVVAVGGDGTVNEIASALVGTKTALGIIPTGSGNGLARHLGIPLQTHKAIQTVMESRTILIDSATINGKSFFCTAGIGFDAQVADDYAKAGTRGLPTYAKEALIDWKSYKAGEYKIETDSGMLQTRALLITVGNANQWGNDFFITPEASLRDGLLDIAVVKPASKLSNIKMIWQLRHKTLTENSNVVYLRSSFARIQRIDGSEMIAHYDGDTVHFGNTVFFECRKDSLSCLSSLSSSY